MNIYTPLSLFFVVGLSSLASSGQTIDKQVINNGLAARVAVSGLSCRDIDRKALRQAAEEWLRSEKLAVGVVNWYSCRDGCAEFEEMGNGVLSEPNFERWKMFHESEKSQRWAQAIRLGNNIAIRDICEGTIRHEVISGRSPFEKPANGGLAINLLDVRFSVGKQTDLGFIYVHLLSGNEISSKKTAQRACREYLDGTSLLGKRLVCVIGPDTIRAADSSYPTDNAFYRIVRPPIVYEPGALYSCLGPQFKTCY